MGKFETYAALGNAIRQFMDAESVPPALLGELLLVHGTEILVVACELDHTSAVKCYQHFQKNLLDLQSEGTKIEIGEG